MNIIVVLEDYIRGINANDIVYDKHKYSGGISRLKVFEKISEKLEKKVYIYGNVFVGECKGLQTINILDYRLNPDVIIFNNAPKFKTLIKINKIFPKTQKIIWFGNPIHHYMFSYLYLNLIDKFVCVSKYHKCLYDSYKIKDRISFIYSGVNVKRLKLERQVKDRNKFIWISAPVKSKGITNLFPLWEKILSINPKAKLDIFGSLALHGGSDQKIFENEVQVIVDEFLKDRKIAKSINIRGWVDNKTLYESIASASYSIVNLNYEGSFETYCQSAVEAQQLGSFVIGGNYGSLPEVTKPGVNSILLNKNDFYNGENLKAKLKQKLDSKYKISPQLTSYTLSAEAWLQVIQKPKPLYRVPSVREIFYIILTFVKYSFKNRYRFQRDE